MKQKQLLSEIKQLLIQKFGEENENLINVAILSISDKLDDSAMCNSANLTQLCINKINKLLTKHKSSSKTNSIKDMRQVEGLASRKTNAERIDGLSKGLPSIVNDMKATTNQLGYSQNIEGQEFELTNSRHNERTEHNVKSQRGNHPIEFEKKNYNRYGSHTRKINKNSIYINEDDQEPGNSKNQFLRQANFSSVNPIDTFIERNTIKKSAIDGVLSNKMIAEDLYENDRRKKNLSTVAKPQNTNKLNYSFADNLKNIKRLSPNQNRTRENLSTMDDNSSIILQNSTMGSIYSVNNPRK